MSVKYEMKAADPDSIPMTLTVTMTLGEWKRLKSQLAVAVHPATELSCAVSKMVIDAGTHFTAEPEKSE